MFEFKILKRDSKSKARRGAFTTPHGVLQTPELAIVATDGVIKSIPKEKITSIPANLLIVNTYHIFVKNIIEKLNTPDKIHNYTGFNKPISSDSGGFQVFSLGFGKSHGVGKVGTLFPGYGTEGEDVHFERLGNSALPGGPTEVKNVTSNLQLTEKDKDNPLIISEEGAEFEFDGRKIKLTPEISMDLQHQIGADIMFAFDECTSPLNSYEYTKQAMERTHRWLERCISFHKEAQYHISQLREPAQTHGISTAHVSSRSKVVSSLPQNQQQALFAVIQGGYFEDLRTASAKFMGKQDVPGFGIGGSLGKTKEEILKVLEWTMPHLPDEKPRHLLGIGQVRDLFEGVERGVDMFDCVIPTREARHKVLYTKKGKLTLRKMKALDDVIENNCGCEACKNNITMKQLYEYFLKRDPLAFYYSSVHNIQFFVNLMKEIRESIENESFQKLKEEYFKVY